MWHVTHAAAYPGYMVVCFRHFPDGRGAYGKTYVPYDETHKYGGGFSYRTLRSMLRCQRYVASRKITDPDEGNL